MLYPITRPLAKIALSVFFRKLHLSGLENIDWEKPVILAANHPTAFIEPCILACWLPKPLHFMVRGDFFLKPLSNWILRDYNMIPFYRMEDAGVAGVKENYKSVEETAAVLRSHHPVLILAEGHTVHEKRLRPLMKGTGRVALGAQEQYPDLDIQLVPVGVNYTYADRFRSEVMIHFGAPIRVRDYVPAYQANPANALRDITEALRVELEKHVVIIREKSDERWTDQLLIQYRNNQAAPFAPHTVFQVGRLESEKRITAQVNNLGAEEKANWKSRVEKYWSDLKRLGVSDRALSGKNGFSLGPAIALILGAPLFLLSFLIHFLPLWLAGRIGYGKLVPRYEFKASVALVAGMVLYLLLALLLLVFGVLLLGWAMTALLFVLAGLSGWFGLWYRSLLDRAKAWLQIRWLSPQEKAELQKLRTEIGDFFHL